MESKAECPFLSKELLSRIPQDKLKEMQSLYSSDPMSSMLQQDEEGINIATTCFPQPSASQCPVTQQVAQLNERSKGGGGACPFISSQHTDPALDFFEVGWPLKYKMRYGHHLNQRVFYSIVEEKDAQDIEPTIDSTEQNSQQLLDPKKVDNEESEEEESKKQPQYKRRVVSYKEIKLKQARLRSYPPVLLHTLFHEDPRFDSYRSKELSQLFFFGDEIKSLGNDCYLKGDYYTALDYYEQCLTLYNWLELKDEKGQRIKLTTYEKRSDPRTNQQLKDQFPDFAIPQIKIQQQITDDNVFNIFKDLNPDQSHKRTKVDSDDSEYEDVADLDVLDKENLMTLIVNLLQNSFACYMKLCHYKEAKKCQSYIKSLMPDYLKTYLMAAQVAYFNRASTIQDLRSALKQCKEGLYISRVAVESSQHYLPVMRQLEKFESLLEKQLQDKITKETQLLEKLFIQAQKIITFQKSKGNIVSPPLKFERAYSDFKVISKMHQKYQDILEYFRESRMSKEVLLTVQEYQKFDETYQDMNYFLHSLNLQFLDQDVKKQLSQTTLLIIDEKCEENTLILSIVRNLMEKLAHEKFVASKGINIVLMQYSMEILDREEEEEKERRKKEIEKQRKLDKKYKGDGILGMQGSIVVNGVFFVGLVLMWWYFREHVYSYFLFGGQNKQKGPYY